MATTPDSGILDRKYVRVTARRAGGLVAFDFAIGAPEIFVELMMPEAAFVEFCRTNNVTDITHLPVETSDYAWRLDQVMKGI